MVAHLRDEQSREVADREQMVRVAAISADDTALGEVIGDAFAAVGKNGVVTVQANDGPGLELELIEGMRFRGSYVSPHMVTDPERMEAVLEDAYIVISGERPSSADELLPLLDQLIPTGKPLLILGEHIAGDALATLVVNKLRGLVTSVAVPTPEYGPQRRSMHEDLAILTGGSPVTQELGLHAGQHPALAARAGRARRRRPGHDDDHRRPRRPGGGRAADPADSQPSWRRTATSTSTSATSSGSAWPGSAGGSP